MQGAEVSIIVPVYNTCEYLPKCIESLLEQDFEGYIELIMVNDGSTDASGRVLETYAQQYPQIKVLTQENAGPSVARNRALDIAKGKYIMFCDSDDYYLPQMVKKMVASIEKNQSDLAICFFERPAPDGTKVLAFDLEDTYEGEQVMTHLLRKFYQGKNDGLYAMCNKIFKAEIIERLHLRFQTDLKAFEDVTFNFRYLFACQKVSVVKEALYFYNETQNSLTNRFHENQYETWCRYDDILLSEKDRLPFEINYHEFYVIILYRCAMYLAYLVGSGETKKAKAIMRDTHFLQACRYRNCVGGYVKGMAFLVSKKCVGAAVLLAKARHMFDRIR